jgi:putative transposase
MLHTALVLWQHAYLNEGEVQSVSRMLISIKQLIFFSFYTLQERFLHWIKPPTTLLLLGMPTDLARGKSELLAENALLRQQLIILRRQIKRPTYRKADRFILVLLARMVQTWKQALFIVQEDDNSSLAS